MRLFLSLILLFLFGHVRAESVAIRPGQQVVPIEAPSIQLEFPTEKEKYYQIESSENLKDWKREGYAFPGNGQRMAAMVSNHGLSRIFYRIGNQARVSDVAPVNPYGLSALSLLNSTAGQPSWNDLTDKPNTLTGLGVDTGTSGFLRELGTSGFNSISAENKHIWRLIEKLNRERTGGSIQYGDRFRSVSFGDSVAARVNNQASGFWGYGGGDAELLGFTKEAQAVPTQQTPAAYSAWSAGVFTLLDEWERVPGGVMVHLDSTIPGGTFVEKTNYTAPMHSVIVNYMSRESNGTGAENYGSFRVQYRINNSGSWVDCTSSMVLGGQGSAIGGVVSTDNGSLSERIGVAIFDLPRSDSYAIRLIANDGRVRLVKVLFNNGGLKFGPANQIQLGGSIDADFSLGGRGIASHFRKMTQAGLNDVLGYIDPHVVVYKSANEWSLSRYEAYWPELAERIMIAAPDATLIVAGSHPQNSLRGHLDERAIEVDDFLREWCANTPGAIFVDIRQNFPEFEGGFEGNSGDIDDLWADGVHIGGKGEYVVSQLIWDAIQPAMDYAKVVQQSSTNWSNILPMVPTEIRLFDSRTITNRTNKLALTVHPRESSSLMIRSTSAPYRNSDQSWLYESGLWVRASTDVYPSSLSLFSDGQTAITFGHHPSLHALQGLAVGIGQSHTTNAVRAADGYRLRVVSPIYGKKNGLIVEGRTDSPTDTRLFGIDVDSTDQNPGNPLWSWMEDGTVIYEGSTPDTNQATFRFEEPAQDITITTPAKSGTIGVVPSYPSRAAAVAAGLTAGDNYWNTTTSSLKTILP